MLYCAIIEEEYKRISTCETAKDIWDRLENIHGDANKVKEIESTSTLEESENGEDREDSGVIPRTSKRMSRKKQNKKSQSIQNHQKNQKNEVQQQENTCCYKCGKPGHMKLKCSNIKKKNHIISTWSNEDDQEEMTNICLKKREETDEACFNAILDCDLKKKNHKSWSNEDEYKEENNHEIMENQCFMAMGEINKVCPTPTTYCDKCDELQDDIELVLNGYKKVLNGYKYKKLTHEKKDWEIQLEEYNKLRNEKNKWDTQLKEYLVENNLLQEENFELRKQISSLHKSPIHYFDRSKSSRWLNSYKSTEKGSTAKCPTLNKLTEESSKSTNKAAASLFKKEDASKDPNKYGKRDIV
ncbi:uncharacterized protein [Nicotiana sylvestris]|uniref:uncharacterized protein n=1 Tax=Nicotiana sylvestris TaxID=4096 RepID=UPI00388C4D13